MNDNNYTVYMHVNKINNKRYIGITKQEPKKRWRNGDGYKGNIHFYNSITKYGWDNFDHEIISSNLTKDEAKNFEHILVLKLNSNDRKYGYNKTEGGDTVCEFSDETREKMSKAKKGLFNGKNNPMYGISPKQRMDKETYSQWLVNHIKKGTENPNSKSVICITTNEIFDTICMASDKYSIQSSDITTCCQGKLKSAGKHPITNKPMQWQYYNDYLNNIEVEIYNNDSHRKIICLNTNEIFNTIKEASQKYNIPASNITLCCQQKYARAGKLPNTNEELIWQYIEDYKNNIKPLEKRNNGLLVKCINTGEIFKSLKSACRKYNLKNPDGIKKCCDGLQKKSGNHPLTNEPLNWEYVS